MNRTQRSGPKQPESKARPVSVSSDEEEEFRLALEAYRLQSGRMFPTWTEILEVLRSVGYAKRVWRPVEIETSLGPSC